MLLELSRMRALQLRDDDLALATIVRYDIAVCGLAVVAGLLATWQTIEVGESGSESVWGDWRSRVP